MDRVRILQLLQFLHDYLTFITYPKTCELLASISYLLTAIRSFFLMILYCVNIVLHRYPVSSLLFLTLNY
jgi:hypothetical protein